MTGRRSIPGGFTLLEMLVATAMVSVLVASLYASLSIAFRARRSALAAVQATRQGAWSMELIEADLRSAMIPNGVLAGEFVGTSGEQLGGSAGDEVTFYAAAMDVAPGPSVGDVKEIEYVCQPAPDTGQMLLVRRVTTNLLAPQTPQPAEEVLCRGVRGFLLRYFDGSSWLDNWDSTTQGNVLPKAVEVTIDLEGPDGQEGTRISQVVMIPCGQDSDAQAESAGGFLP